MAHAVSMERKPEPKDHSRLDGNIDDAQELVKRRLAMVFRDHLKEEYCDCRDCERYRLLMGYNSRVDWDAIAEELAS